MDARDLDRASAASRYRRRRWARVNAALGFAAFGLAAIAFVVLLLIGATHAR